MLPPAGHAGTRYDVSMVVSVDESSVLNARIIHRHDVTDELAIVRIAPDEGEVPAFIPGQFCTLGLPAEDDDASAKSTGRDKPRLVRRAYSIASSADERHYLELFLILVPQGRFSPRLFALQKGDRLYLDPIARGDFTLQHVEPDKDLVMVATGTGVAPFISMLRTYPARGEKRWNRFVLIHGVRRAADLAYDEELRRIAKEDKSVVYVPTVTREPENSNWSGLRGRVQHALEDATYQEIVGSLLAPHHCHVFLCGNPGMIEAVSQMLIARGFTLHRRDEPGNLHYERYW